MKITLKIDGKEKTFVNEFISARMLRETMKLNEKVAEKRKDENYSVTQQLDDMAELAVKAFNQQFTFDELWDGLPANEIQNELMRIFNEILGEGGFALKGEPSEGKSVI